MACELRPEIPEMIIGDPTRLRQIIINLVGNAIKFTNQGEVVVRVDLDSHLEDAVALHFEVSDTGIGIPPDKQKLVFEPFAQADGSMTRRYGGTGLGLTISMQLVEMMRGHIWVKSEVGKGSVFNFTAPFPLGKPITSPKETENISLAGIPVLVVDDNATNRRILDGMLSRWNMKPTMAVGGNEALSILRQARDRAEHFPLVLTDAHMPDMDGFTLAGQTNHDPTLAGATIMMLTSGAQRGDAVRCKELGVSTYLTKPIRQSDLREAILTVLGTGSLTNPAHGLVTRHSIRERRRGLRILLVEDDPVNQILAVRMLEKRGHTVTTAGNGLEALAELGKCDYLRFDLVLMDIQMPEMDGFEATAAIRLKEKRNGGHLPIIAMAAHAMKGDRERCLAASMDGYIPKPIQVEELLVAIDTLFPIVAAVRTPPAPEAASVYAESDTELLTEMAALFIRDCPKLLTDIQEAIARHDAESLRIAAHTLKGSVSNFTFPSATDAALSLEMMGRQGNLAQAEKANGCLEDEIARVNSILADQLKKAEG